MKKTLLFGVLLVSYFAVAHIALTSEGGQNWAALIAILPLLGWWLKALFANDASRLRRGTILLVGLVVAGLGWWFWSRWVGYAEWVYLLQSVGGMLLMASLFGVSLTMKEGDWVTRLATIVHGGSLPPEIARYTRSVCLVTIRAQTVNPSAVVAPSSNEGWSNLPVTHTALRQPARTAV